MPRVTIHYSGSTSYELDPSVVADALIAAGLTDPTDEQIKHAICVDAIEWLDTGDVSPPETSTHVGDGCGESVRAALAEILTSDEES